MAQSECECCKWHAPRPTRYFDANGVAVCNVTADAVNILLARHLKRGRVAKVDQRGFTAFQRDLAASMFDAGVHAVIARGEVEASDDEVTHEPEGDEVAVEA